MGRAIANGALVFNYVSPTHRGATYRLYTGRCCRWPGGFARCILGSDKSQNHCLLLVKHGHVSSMLYYNWHDRHSGLLTRPRLSHVDRIRDTLVPLALAGTSPQDQKIHLLTLLSGSSARPGPDPCLTLEVSFAPSVFDPARPWVSVDSARLRVRAEHS